MKKKFSIKSFFILIFSFLICFTACTKKSVFQTIDEYIKKADNPHLAILSTVNFDFFGTEIYDDGKITCNYKNSSNEGFQLTISENYKVDGIYFFYYNQEYLMSSTLNFKTEGYIYPEPYNTNQEIEFSTSNVPQQYRDRVVVLFELFLSTLNTKILKPCDLTLKDFGYFTH